MRQSRKGTLIAIVLLVMALRPLAAYAGVADVLSLLASIRSVLNGAGRMLSQLHAVEAKVSALEQQVVWPAQAIAGVQASIQQARSQFAGLASQIRGQAIASATLPNPQRLEAVLRSPTSGNLDGIAPSYTAVYLSLPSPGHATARQRGLIDMDDAFAIESLKAASVSDQAGNNALSVADLLEAQASQAAPGSAGMLAAEAQTGELANQAMLQKMLAAELRQEAGLLAHGNARRKQSAESLQRLRHHLLNLLGGH